MQLTMTVWTYPNPQLERSYLLALKCRGVGGWRDQQNCIIEEEKLQGPHLGQNNVKHVNTDGPRSILELDRICFVPSSIQLNGAMVCPYPQHFSQLRLNSLVNNIGTAMIFFQLANFHLCVHFGALNNLTVAIPIVTSFINRFQRNISHGTTHCTHPVSCSRRYSSIHAPVGPTCCTKERLRRWYHYFWLLGQ